MDLKIPKPKLQVKINKTFVPVSGFIKVIRKSKEIIHSIETDIIFLIMDEIAKLQDEVGALPSAARQQYNDMLNNANQDYSPLAASDKNQYHYKGDEEREQALFDGINEGSSSISLPNIRVLRELRIVSDDSGQYYLTPDPHNVNYTMVHLKGFEKYVRAKGGGIDWYRSVEGRDIMYTAMSRAMPAIRQLMINKIIEVAKNG